MAFYCPSTHYCPSGAVIQPFPPAMDLSNLFGFYADLPRSDLEARYGGGPSQRCRVEGVDVHYRDEGRGPPVVLLHGIGSSLHTWQGWVDHLIDRFRVVRVDLPGFGLSCPLPDGDYRLERIARFVAAFADVVGLERFHLAGSSMGGMTAVLVAHQFAPRVEKLILVDTGGYAPARLLPIRVARLPLAGRLLRYFTPRRLVRRELCGAYGHPDHVDEQLVRRHHDLTRCEQSRAVFIRRARADWVIDPEIIRAVDAPTLVIWGGKDSVLPVSMAHAYARDLPDARLIVFDDLGHVPMEEDPERTARAAVEFLEG